MTACSPTVVPLRAPARRARRALLAALAMLPALAAAHGGSFAGLAAAPHGFLEGLLHPFTGFDHVGATLAAGVWGARSERRMWMAPLVFVSCLVLGALASASGLVLADVEPMISFSLLALGLLVASRTYVPPALAVALVGGFAVYHGVAHGLALGSDAALAGLLCGTVALCACGTAMGVVLRSRNPWWTRGTGLALAVFGATHLANF